MKAKQLTLVYAALAAADHDRYASSASAQQTTGAPCSANATTTVDPKYVPPAAIELRRHDQHERQDFKALLAGAHRAAEGCSERSADHDRRSGLRHLEHLRRRHSNADAGSDCKGRSSIHAVPLHVTVLPSRAALLTGRNHHSVGFGVIAEQATGFPGYDADIGLNNASHRRNPEGKRIRHVLVRQEPQHAGLPVQHVGTVRSVAERNGVRVLLRLHGWRVRPVEAVAVPGSHPDFSVDRAPRLQPHHRHGGRGDQAHQGAERRRA